MNRPPLRRLPRTLRVHLATGLLAPLLAAAPLAAQTGAISGEATLTAPAGSESEIKAKESLRVTSVLAPGTPVAEDHVIVAVDLTDLEKDLAEARARMGAAQEQQRRRTTDQPVTRGGGTSTSSGGGQGPDRLSTMNQDQQDYATRDASALQSRISAAPIRAPKDGYLVRSLFQVGQTTAKRKPAALFVPLAKTSLALRVPATDGAALASSKQVVVVSQEDPAKTFRAKVAGSSPAGELLVLDLEPLDLPFLPLGAPTPVTVEAAR